MKPCTICKHEHREKIERVLLKLTPEKSSLTLEKIADEFEISVTDLQRHVLFHTPYGEPAESDSIVRRTKILELDMLGEAAQEYMNTMQCVGGRIRNYTADVEDSRNFEKSLTKPTVDLYLGCGDNLQKAVRAIADIDNFLNGPKDDGLSGLAALTVALQKSRGTEEVEKDD